MGNIYEIYLIIIEYNNDREISNMSHILTIRKFKLNNIVC